MIERRHFHLVSWELDAGEDLYREAPSTFWIPARDRRAALSPGDIVKLSFRMAVRIRPAGRNCPRASGWTPVTSSPEIESID